MKAFSIVRRTVLFCMGLVLGGWLMTVPAYADDSQTLYVIVPDGEGSFAAEGVRHAREELERLAEERGLNYELRKGADTAAQSSALDEAIANSASAVVLWPVRGDAPAEAAQRVLNADIPLIVFERSIGGLHPTGEVLPDNEGIGQMAGLYFNEALGVTAESGPTIGILELATTASPTSLERSAGFETTASDQVHIIQKLSAVQRSDAREAMRGYLESAAAADISEIAGIYAHDDEILLGALDAIAAYDGEGEFDLRVLSGVGGRRELLMHAAALHAVYGAETVSYLYSPAMIREAIADAMKAMAGDILEPIRLLDTEEIDREGLADYLSSEAYELRYQAAPPTFDDVSNAAWYAPYVQSAATEGLMAWEGTSFEPNETLSVNELRALLGRLLPFFPVPALSGSGTDAMLREDLAVLVDDMMSTLIAGTNDGFPYADEASIDSTKRDAVMRVHAEGLMIGVGHNRFAPKEAVTRAEAATVLHNVMTRCLNASKAT